MRINITGRNIDLTQGLKNAVETKMSKLEKYFTPDTDVYVTLSVEKERQKVEVTIPTKGNITNYIKEHEGIQKVKKRIDDEGSLISEGNPIYVYEGIRLKNKYRSAE